MAGAVRVPFLLVGPPGIVLVSPVPADGPVVQPFWPVPPWMPAGASAAPAGPASVGRTELSTWLEARQQEAQLLAANLPAVDVPWVTVFTLVTTTATPGGPGGSDARSRRGGRQHAPRGRQAGGALPRVLATYDQVNIRPVAQAGSFVIGLLPRLDHLAVQRLAAGLDVACPPAAADDRTGG